MDLKSLIEGNNSVQVFVASERDKQALHLIAPESREAIEQTVVPQIEELITSVEVLDALESDLVLQIQEAFKLKNTMYTSLCRYKSIDQSDSQFMEDLIQAFAEWSSQTRESLKTKPPEESEAGVSVVQELAAPAQDLEISTDSPFDLNEVIV